MRSGAPCATSRWPTTRPAAPCAGRSSTSDYAVVYFAPVSTSQIVPGNGRVLTNREGYAQETFVAEANAEGRLGEAASWRLWAAFIDGRERFLDRGLALQDPTPTENDPLVDGGRPVVRPGGLGRGDLFVGARFAGGASLRARLPAGFEASGLLHMREGFPVPYYQVASTGDPTAGSKNVLVSGELDRYREPGLVLLDLRLARAFGLGRGRLTLGLDVWNATNTAATLQLARDVELPAFGRPREIVRPRLIRLGLDWRFCGTGAGRLPTATRTRWPRGAWGRCSTRSTSRRTTAREGPRGAGPAGRDTR